MKKITVGAIINRLQKKKGITLIALVVTIIVLLILAGVTLALIAGSEGILGRTSKAVDKNKEATAKEQAELLIMDEQSEFYDAQYVNQSYAGTKRDYVLGKLKEEGTKTQDYYVQASEDGTIKLYENSDFSGEAVITGTMQEDGTIKWADEESNGDSDNTKPAGGISGAIAQIKESGKQDITMKIETADGEEKEVSYATDIIYHQGDVTLDGTTPVEGATLNNKVYAFGDQSDCGTASTNATRTVVVKIDGDLTIENGVTITSVCNSSGYGGPKGMIIHCTGTLTNKGTITMTARGAKAVGENVYLWQNADGTYEYVPATGGNGAVGAKNIKSTYSGKGNKGANGSNRQTGGGGAGGLFRFAGDGNNYVCNVGNGGNGSAYSGGSGSGGLNVNRKGSGTLSTGSGSSSGGAGGVAVAVWYGGSGATGRGAGGGAGNTGGVGQYNQANNQSLKGSNGTGGLLVLYSKDIMNTGNITSNGTTGGNASGANAGYAGGGSSGGGSINIFYHEQINGIENIQANGGSSNYGGGEGGIGSITIGSVATGSFECVYKNY